MNGAVAEYVEETLSPRVAAVPLGHLSVELGHLYMEDFAAGPDRLDEMFQHTAPWVRAVRESRSLPRGKTPRISTCFLVDDYFGQLSSPREVVPQLVTAAEAAGLQIDYLVRESACAVAGEIDVARLVETRLVADPPPGTTGRRPPLSISGWLCNGERSPVPTGIALRGAAEPWRPPSENGANRHSIFVDVQLWDDHGGERRWSCPYLAAVWHLLRLGLLRYDGRPVVEPVVDSGASADTWGELPPVTQLTERPAPFAAYRTFSVLAGRFMPVELAVRTILGQYAVEPTAAEQVRQRASGEGIELPASIVERIEYVFAGAGPA
ncbi:MAG TPA: SCO2522 family protein [Micromonosporaceae bacterium]|nr:SCO2522 family protein [Micromonosporaceae bacterium]